ncbi:MAG: GNAT family N-acetyltransferase [Peptococcaceae bacterium]
MQRIWRDPNGKAVNIANMQKRSYIWLGVWEKNESAIRFYEKKGFYAVGTHAFFLGEEEQRDFIMRKNLDTSSIGSK